jgi:hypothetical protein
MKSKKGQGLLTIIIVLIAVVVIAGLIYTLVLGAGKTALNATVTIPPEFLQKIQKPTDPTPSTPAVDISTINKSMEFFTIEKAWGTDSRDESLRLSTYIVVGADQNVYGHYIRVQFNKPIKEIPYGSFKVYQSDDIGIPDEQSDWDTTFEYDAQSSIKVRRIDAKTYELGPFDPDDSDDYINIWFDNQNHIWISEDGNARYQMSIINSIAFDAE